jgi:flagellar biosynthesis protein FlhF
MGFLPRYAERVLDHLRFVPHRTPAGSFAEELSLTRNALIQLWRPCPPVQPATPHVFVGPHGSGKTTVLCKWLTQSVLLEGQSARVWRLDGRIANTAETLGVHCEILGVPIERSWVAGKCEETMQFVDLPGVTWSDKTELQELSRLLQQLASPQVHLVLNAGYDTQLLLSQARAFASLPVADVIMTHLDEEERWGKLWNLILGTNYSIRFLNAGQNIPGDFREASAEEIVDRQFPLK